MHNRCRVNGLGPTSATRLEHCSRTETWCKLCHEKPWITGAADAAAGRALGHGMGNSSRDPVHDTTYLHSREAPAPAEGF